VFQNLVYYNAFRHSSRCTSTEGGENHINVPSDIFPVKAKFDRLCGLVVRVPGYTTDMYCASCEVRTKIMYVMWKKVDRLCGLVARVPGYTTDMYCASCEVRTEIMYVMWKKVDRLSGLVVSVPGYWSRDVLCFLWGTIWIYICYEEESIPPLWSSGQSSFATEQRCIVFPVRYEQNLYMLCRRK
jgi:hypothetical protein